MEDWIELLSYLQDGFVRDSLARVDRMTSQLDLLDRGHDFVEPLLELRRDFHGLSGSGASYGFPLLTDIGSEGERELSRHLTQGGPTTAEERRRWHRLLVRARSALAPFAAVDSAPHIVGFS